MIMERPQAEVRECTWRGGWWNARVMRQIGEWGGLPPGGVRSPDGSNVLAREEPPPGELSYAAGATPPPASEPVSTTYRVSGTPELPEELTPP